MVKQQEISLIACIAQNGAIGFHNHLLYPIRQDMQRFKTLTTGHTVIMGRRTFESLPKGALPNRRNIVLSRTVSAFPGAECFASLVEALAHCQEDEEVFIIGGASVYAEALPLAHRLYLTEVDATAEQADVWFPEYCRDDWRLVRSEAHEPDEKNAAPYTFADYERVTR